MKVVISQYYKDFTVEISELTKSEAKALVEKISFPPEPKSVAEPAVSETITLASISDYRQRALRDALLYFTRDAANGDRGSKTQQIKFLRALTELGLFEARDFVEYVCWNGVMPEGCTFFI